MIICITGNFDKYDSEGFKTGQKEFIVSHGYDTDTGKLKILPHEPPELLGAVFDDKIGEWILPE